MASVEWVNGSYYAVHSGGSAISNTAHATEIAAWQEIGREYTFLAEAHDRLFHDKQALVGALESAAALGDAECQIDKNNPCYDARPGDVLGRHWGGGAACPFCTLRALRDAETIFTCDGERFTRAQMLEANVDDEHCCAWLRTAKPGDRYPAVADVACVGA